MACLVFKTWKNIKGEEEVAEILEEDCGKQRVRILWTNETKSKAL